MKKIKKLFMLLGIATVFTLASCGGSMEYVPTQDPSNNDLIGTNQNTPGGSADEKNDKKDDPDYKKSDINIETMTDASRPTDVESTVEAVYDSVVSMNCTSASSVSAGSGVLFASDEKLGFSYIVTCFHVIDGASSFSVTLSDNTTKPAKYVGGNATSDIAVLSIEGTNYTLAKFFDNSDKLKLGSQVVCIGNPLGTLPGSVSSGIVSYVNREIETSSYNKMKLIQTDVAINSGNSGGALFNTSGALIGIVNAKYSSSGIEGLGFAIPINEVKSVIDSIMSTASYDIANDCWDAGYVKGDWQLGFTLADGVTFGPFQSQVVYVRSVDTNYTSSGSDSFKVNDIVKKVTLKINSSDTPSTKSVNVSQASNVMSAIYSSNLKIGDEIEVEVSRNNSTITVNVKLVQYIYSV